MAAAGDYEYRGASVLSDATGTAVQHTQLWLPETCVLPKLPRTAPWSAPPTPETLSPSKSLRGSAWSTSELQTPRSVPDAVAALAAAAAALSLATQYMSPMATQASARPRVPQLEELRRRQEQAMALLEEQRVTHMVQVCTVAELQMSTERLQQIVEDARRQPPPPQIVPSLFAEAFAGGDTGARAQPGVGDLASVDAPPGQTHNFALSPRCMDRKSLLEEAEHLRSQLRNGEDRLQAVTLDASRANAAARAQLHQHQQWMAKARAEAVTLQSDNVRLERNIHQAGLEEGKAADLARCQDPAGGTDDPLARLRADVDRLLGENQALAGESQAARGELTCIRGSQNRAHEFGRCPSSAASRSGTPARIPAAPSRTVGGYQAYAIHSGKGPTLAAVDRALAKHASVPNLMRKSAWS